MEASRTVTRWEGRSVVAPDQDLWSPRRSPLGKVQTGGAGSAPTTRRAADGRAGAWVARPGWWGCAFRGRVRARPAPPDHVETEEGSDRKRAVAPDLAWNTNHRRSNPHPSALPHHDGSRPRVCAVPTPARWSEQAPAAFTPCGPDGSDTLRLGPGAPGGWTPPRGWAGQVRAAFTPVCPRREVRPPETRWGRGVDQRSPAVSGVPGPCTFHPLRHWEGMGVLYVRAVCRAHRPLQGAFLPPLGLGWDRLARPSPG